MKFLHPITQEELSDALGSMTANSYCIAGCTDFLLQKGDDFRDADVLVDLTGCDALRQIQFKPDEASLVIGATCTHGQVAAHPVIQQYYPALAMACGNVGSTQIRNRGTIGGSIANAAPAADVYPCLLIYEAKVELLSADGQRTCIPAKDFISEDGIPDLTLGEIITAVHLPLPESNSKSVFAKLGERKQVTIAKINMAGLMTYREDKPDSLKLAIGAIGARAKLLIVPAENLTSAGAFSEYCSEIVKKAIPERTSVAYKSVAVKGLAMDLYELLVK